MTRILSEILGAKEPAFGLQLQKIEDANGLPSTDIRLTSEIMQKTQVKVKQLGLDPHDTTGPELYAVLKQKLHEDEVHFVTALQTAAPKLDDTTALVAHGLRSLPFNKHCYGMKGTAAKRLIKAQPPKRALKLLGYRSLDSMLKHEPVQLIFTAAWLSESEQWVKRFLKAYKKLTAHDFEPRPLRIEQPTSARWQKFSVMATEQHRHNVFAFKELAAITILPLSAESRQEPAFAALTTATLALHAMNEVHAASTFLKLHQVKTNFGQIVGSVIANEPAISSRMFDRSVPWHIIQRYYARLTGKDSRVSTEIFEPHLQPEDLAWLSVEKALSFLAPALAFWEDTEGLALMHNHKPVSLNITDAILSHCNNLSFEERITGYVQQSVWHELMVRYLRHERVEHAVFEQLEPELVPVS